MVARPACGCRLSSGGYDTAERTATGAPERRGRSATRLDTRQPSRGDPDRALRSPGSGDLSRVPAARNRAGVRASDASDDGRPAEVVRSQSGSSGARWPSCKTHALTDPGPASVRRPPSDAWGGRPGRQRRRPRTPRWRGPGLGPGADSGMKEDEARGDACGPSGGPKRPTRGATRGGGRPGVDSGAGTRPRERRSGRHAGGRVPFFTRTPVRREETRLHSAHPRVAAGSAEGMDEVSEPHTAGPGRTPLGGPEEALARRLPR